MTLPPGHSGFFSAPSDHLDPHLFTGDHLRDEVRQYILATLENGLSRYVDLSGASEWLHVWLAGSGITYQWDADRGNGDLDVLFGVDETRFAAWNPEYKDIPEDSVAAVVNERLKSDLWPHTANVDFGGQHYEVTFYWNPGTGSDIRGIHPYAAYDVKRDVWVVRPPELPPDPRTLYPQSWFTQAGHDQSMATALHDEYTRLQGMLSSNRQGTPAWHNAGAALHFTHAKAKVLFDDIHTGRREAFGEQGHGYGDWHNFRWQQGKASGAVQALHEIVSLAHDQDAVEDTALYGGPVDAADMLVTRAMMRYSSPRYNQ